LVQATNDLEILTMPTDSDDFAERVLLAPDTDPTAMLDHFSRRLIGLARAHLSDRLQHKVDPEDVVQSAYKSLLVRYGDEVLAEDGLWSLLTRITIRKCADRARYHQAECRDLQREGAASCNPESNSVAPVAPGREPTPEEAAVLAETVARLLHQLNGDERSIVELCLLGYSTQEISDQTGRAERSVRRLRERVRKHLERQVAEETH
jgi:RNA polymerase sigma-70 factor (ECF subfamily)